MNYTAAYRHAHKERKKCTAAQYASISLTVSRDFFDASSSRARIIIWIQSGDILFAEETQLS
jgi:hypothetical protein